MHIEIGNYPKWWGPYQIADLLQVFGVSDDRCHKIGEWLSEKTPLSKICQSFYDYRRRHVVVHIDKWDCWNVDSTLSIILVPLLTKLRDEKHGGPLIDKEDVPEHLWEKDGDDGDERHDERHAWLMSELIWTFQQLHPDTDWECQYSSGNIDIIWVDSDKEGFKELQHGPNHTIKFDKEGWTKHNARIDNGLRLFGKYFRSLWC